jgi:hypothetical protein
LPEEGLKPFDIFRPTVSESVSESGGQNIRRKVATILGARVGGMRAERVKRATRMLPDISPMIPVKA